MTDYGDSANYAVVIATAMSGSGTSGSPTSGRVYMDCEECNGTYKGNLNIKQVAGGSSHSTRDGKRNYSITLTNVWLKAYTGVSTHTAAKNAIVQKLRQAHIAGAAPLYIFVWNRADSAWESIGMSTSGTEQNFMIGYPGDFNVTSGIVSCIKSLTFTECLN